MNGTLMQAPVPVAGRLATGTTRAGCYQVRPAAADDAAAIRDFITGLSVRTQYFRFFTAVSPPSRGLLRALTAENARADVLLVTDECGTVIGHGMAVDGCGDRAGASDIGLVIADGWQGLGLGTVLLRLLVARAADRGVRTLLLEVLPENSRMLGIIDRHWPDAGRKRTLDALEITARIAGTPSVPASAPGPWTAGGRNDRARTAA
jgi:ribosomal protein S18 acetylase RimI-like enzyme